MSSEPNLSVKRSVTIHKIVNFDGNRHGHGNGNGMCNQALTPDWPVFDNRPPDKLLVLLSLLLRTVTPKKQHTMQEKWHASVAATNSTVSNPKFVIIWEHLKIFEHGFNPLLRYLWILKFVVTTACTLECEQSTNPDFTNKVNTTAMGREYKLLKIWPCEVFYKFFSIQNNENH